MNTLASLLQSETMIQLVTTLLHTLWQGLLTAGMLYGALRLIPACQPGRRYAATLTACGLVILAGMVTWGVLEVDMRAASEAVETTGKDTSVAETTPSSSGDNDAPTTEAVAATPETVPWQGIIGSLWCLGVVVMLVRASCLVRGAGRLRQKCRHLDHPDIRNTIAELCKTMNIGRRLEVLVGEQFHTPAVMGVVWPTLMIPAGMVTTPLPPEQMRMVLAHELAHIRRYDYLVNLFQLLLEALLFFNPAIWWISRQVRLEREACCDAEAVRITGAAHDYARTLVDFAARLKTKAPSAVAAFADRDEGSLLARVKRLVRPGHRPIIRVPWISALVVLVASSAILLTLQLCTNTVIRVAAGILSPRERIDKITQIARTHRVDKDVNDYEKLAKVLVRGTISTTDDSPLPEKWRYINARVERPSATIGISLDITGNTFEGEVTPGSLSLCANAPGYAPVFLGPFKTAPGEALEGLEVKLERGFPAPLQFNDEAGEPITGVSCQTFFKAEGMNGVYEDFISDAEGRIVIENATVEAGFHISMRAGGYQYDTSTMILDPDAPRSITLRAAKPISGRVVSSETGAPIADALFLIASRKGFEDTTTDPREDWVRRRGPSWRTDEGGYFSLDSLRDECVYVFYVEAAGHRPRLVEGMRTGRQGLEISMEPPLEIRGTIIGKLDRIHRYRDVSRISYWNSIKIDDCAYSSQHKAVVTMDGDRGHFHIANLFPGNIRLDFPGKALDLKLEKSIPDLTVDLREPEDGGPAEATFNTRRVIVNIHPPEGSPMPVGTLRVDYVRPGRNAYSPFWPALENGSIEIEVPLLDDGPGKFRYGPLHAEGYWIADKSGIPIPPGEKPLTLDVQAHPAGAIYGQVIDAAGEPMQDIDMTLVKVEKPETPDNVWPSNNSSNADHPEGRFLLDALPLNGVYRVIASDGRIGHEGRVMSGKITIDEARPIHHIALQIPRGVDVPVRVLDASGVPVVGARISLHYSSPHSHGFAGADESTGADGRFVFRGINPDLEGTHSVRVKPLRGHRGAAADIRVDGSVNTIRLEKGLVLKGVVINDTTGEVIRNTAISLWPRSIDLEYREEITGYTDEQGRFSLPGLEPGQYFIKVKGLRPYGTIGWTDAEGRHWFRDPDNRHSRIDLSKIDTSEDYEIRVISKDDPSLNGPDPK